MLGFVLFSIVLRLTKTTPAEKAAKKEDFRHFYAEKTYESITRYSNIHDAYTETPNHGKTQQLAIGHNRKSKQKRG